jgi:uncharacterized protein (TIGR00251 family)
MKAQARNARSNKTATEPDSRTSQFPVWARWQAGALLLCLHVQPGARRTSIVGAHGQRLKIALHAPPVDGKANEELLRYLADQAGLRRSQLRLISGLASREKSIAIEIGATHGAQLVERLGRAAAPV